MRTVLTAIAHVPFSISNKTKMIALFQASIIVSGDRRLLEAFKQQFAILLPQDSSIQNFQEFPISRDLMFRFETNEGIPFPTFLAASQAFPELTIKLQWTNYRDAVCGSALLQSGKLTEQQVQALAEFERPGSATQLDIAVEENGYLRHALAFRNISASEYAGYMLTGRLNAYFKISKQDNQAELYSSNGLEAEWTECWTYNQESGKSNFRTLIPGAKIDVELYEMLGALAEDFLDEWIWFSQSPLEDIIIEQQKYQRMGLTPQSANIKSEKIKKMAKQESGREKGYRFSTVSIDCEWIKTAITACRAKP
ncbi:MAG TPA: hypothetical protein VEG25_03920 [Burkholderiales bacterium]|nr:hypothetical protein [Burkholderiales bacterium]